MRASLARSLVLDPEVFLFDEPFGALDEITRERLNDELLRTLFELRAFAALFVTHSVAEAVFLSTRVVGDERRARAAIIADIPVPFEYPRVARAPLHARVRRPVRRGLQPPAGARDERRGHRHRCRTRPAPWMTDRVVATPPRRSPAAAGRRRRDRGAARYQDRPAGRGGRRDHRRSGTLVSEVVLNQYQQFMLPPPHQVLEVGFLTWSNFTTLMSALRHHRRGHVHRAGDLDRRSASARGAADEPGQVGRERAVPVGRRAADRADPRAHPVAQLLLRVLADQPHHRRGHHRVLPDRLQHAVRPAVGRRAACTTCSRCTRPAGWTRLWKLQFPAALPAMFAGFRVSAGLAVIGAIVGEFFFKQGQPGLGTNMSVYTSLTRRRAALGVGAHRERARHRRLRLLRLAVAARRRPLVPARAPLTARPSAPGLSTSPSLTVTGRIAASPDTPNTGRHRPSPCWRTT